MRKTRVVLEEEEGTSLVGAFDLFGEIVEPLQLGLGGVNETLQSAVTQKDLSVGGDGLSRRKIEPIRVLFNKIRQIFHRCRRCCRRPRLRCCRASRGGGRGPVSGRSEFLVE